MTAVPFVRPEKTRRTKLPPEEPLIPQRGRRGSGRYWLYLLPGFALLTVIVIVPLVWNIFLSFTEWRGIRPPEFIGLENWIELFGDAKFWTSFGNSIWMIVAMVIVPTLIGLVLAALLFDLVGRKFGGKVASFLRATYYLPQILPAAIAGIDPVWDMTFTDFWHIVLAAVLGLLMGFSLGVLIRHSAGAVVAYFVYSMLLPTVFGVLAGMQTWFADLQPWVDFNYASTRLYDQDMTGEYWTQLATSGAIWLVAPLLIGLWLLRRSEVK